MWKHVVVWNVLLTLTILGMTSLAFAMRSPPEFVPPVTVGTIEYRAPISHMSYIDAHDAATGELLWSRQMYVVVRDPKLERDVQDVYISAIEVVGDALLVTNEAGSQFALDLATLEVKTVKGSARTR